MNRPEKWLPIPDFEGFYEVSDLGRVRSLDRVVMRSNGAPQTIPGRMMKPQPNQFGYPRVQLRPGDGTSVFRTVHSLVLEAFAGPCPPGMECLHGLGGPADNRWPENLRYGTHPVNVAESRIVGSKHWLAKLTEEIVTTCRARYVLGEDAQALADEYGVHHAVMWRAVTRRTWKHVP